MDKRPLAVGQLWYCDHYSVEQWVSLESFNPETGVWWGRGETADLYPLDPGDLYDEEQPKTFGDWERTHGE